MQPTSQFTLTTKIPNNLHKWDLRFIELAKQAALWSKDPSKQVGAVAVGKHKQVLSTGFNGFPRGIDDTPLRLNDRALKYKYVVHAEMNLIYNASLTGVSLENSALYVVGLPVCSECAKGIIQVGIKRVYYMTTGHVAENWLESNKDTIEMFNEVGIEYKFLGHRDS